MTQPDYLKRALTDLFGHEGGYVNHPQDPGGETKYGITKRTYPAENIKALTLDRAAEIYERDFWNKTPAPNVGTYELAYAIFDAAVNSGPKQAVKWLQKAIDVTDDGSWGPKSKATFNAILYPEPDEPLAEEMADFRERIIAARMSGHRLEAMTNMRWDTFGRGWARRIAALNKGLSLA